MSNFIFARWLLLKKHRFSIIFWLLFPIVASSLFMHFAATAQSETRIPVAVVAQDSSVASASLVRALSENELLRVTETDEKSGTTALRRNKYDSLFIIPADFSEKIARGETKELINAYRSERSLFYTPVKEIVLAHVQATSGRMQAAITVQQLDTQLNIEPRWSKTGIIENADQIEHEQQLLRTEFHLHGSKKREAAPAMFSPWLPWSAASLLATFFIFRSIMRERRKLAFARLHFTRFGSLFFITGTTILYTVVLLIFDLCAAFFFSQQYGETFNMNMLVALLGFRLIAIGVAFVFTCLIRSSPAYYGTAFLFTIFIVLLSQYEGRFSQWNPVAAFLDGKIGISFLCLLLIAIFFTLRKESATHA